MSEKADEKDRNDCCPNCGYCPHCKRAAAPVVMPVPYPYPVYPYPTWRVYPQVVPWWQQTTTGPLIGNNTIDATSTMIPYNTTGTLALT